MSCQNPGSVDAIPSVRVGRHVSAGQQACSWPFSRIGQELTQRERCALLLLSQGHTNRQISKLMVVGKDTVKFHLKNVYEKLGARRRIEALLLAQKHGLLPLADVIERNKEPAIRASSFHEANQPAS